MSESEVTDDPYQTLGVKRDASAEQIRAAYRRLAKELHPDLNPGNSEAEERFKNVSTAYELLKDPEQRARFDRGEIDASGAERAQERTYYRTYADSNGGHRYAHAGVGGFEDLDDVFADLFGATGRKAGKARAFRARGGDLRYALTIPFLEAVNGARKRITMPDGKTLDLRIPAGLGDGQTLRLKGKGMPGLGGGPPGDALIEVRVEPHPRFERKGDDIHVDLAVSLAEAVLGARVKVPTVTGPVTLTVPKGSNTGTTLRLKGKGVPRRRGGRGDQLVRLRVVLPKTVDAELESFVRDWSAKHPYDPRRGEETAP